MIMNLPMPCKMPSFGLRGLRSITSTSGGSVASATAGAPSVTKFIHRIIAGNNGNGKTPADPRRVQALFTTLKDAKAWFDKGSAIFVDTRFREDYEAGHIQGALSLCFEQLDELYDQVLGQVSKDRLIVTYCSDPECASAVKLADALVARGHTRVVILLEGLPGWMGAGYPVVSGKEPGR